MRAVGHVEIILYVADQAAATAFYTAALAVPAVLDVPGMTEFALGPGVTLGLMPEAGIARIVSPPLRHPETARGVPRCELYLHVADVAAAYERALAAGAREVSAPAPRDWGDEVAYVADADGHVLAFAAGSAAEPVRRARANAVSASRAARPGPG